MKLNNHRNIVFLFATGIFLLFHTANSKIHQKRGIDSLLILHTNDFHGHISPDENGSIGAARIGAYFKQMKSKRPDVLILDAGDCITGTPVSTIFKGKPIFQIMDMMSYDFGILGNHEFDHGWKLIPEFLEISNHPLLCANAYDPDGKPLGDAPYMIKDVDGIKVGIIGVVTENTPNIIINKGNEGLRFEPVIDVLRKLVPKVKKEADLLIVLSHYGHEEDKALALAINGIHIIVGGHSHTEVIRPILIGSTYIAQAMCYGKRVGSMSVTFDFDNNKVTSLVGNLLKGEHMPKPDKEIKTLVDKWETKVAEKVDIVIGQTKNKLGINTLRTLTEKAIMMKFDTDLSYYNPGGIRDIIPAGKIKSRHIWNVHPFSNYVVIVKYKGKDLVDTILQRTKKKGFKLEDETIYNISTNNFVGDHLVEHFGTKPLSIEHTYEDVCQLVIEHIKKNGVNLTN